jgi:hypothetical protein
LHESGKVSYSGRNAYSSPARLYILGVNPGGDPAKYGGETVGEHTRQIIHELPADWSGVPRRGLGGCAARGRTAWRRASCTSSEGSGSSPDRYLRATCSSFAPAGRSTSRSVRGSSRTSVGSSTPASWRELKPRTILCLGATAGGYVRRQLRANRVVGQFVEQNDRRWKSQAFDGAQGNPGHRGHASEHRGLVCTLVRSERPRAGCNPLIAGCGRPAPGAGAPLRARILLGTCSVTGATSRGKAESGRPRRHGADRPWS